MFALTFKWVFLIQVTVWKLFVNKRFLEESIQFRNLRYKNDVEIDKFSKQSYLSIIRKTNSDSKNIFLFFRCVQRLYHDSNGIR